MTRVLSFLQGPRLEEEGLWAAGKPAESRVVQSQGQPGSDNGTRQCYCGRPAWRARTARMRETAASAAAEVRAVQFPKKSVFASKGAVPLPMVVSHVNQGRRMAPGLAVALLTVCLWHCWLLLTGEVEDASSPRKRRRSNTLLLSGSSQLRPSESARCTAPNPYCMYSRGCNDDCRSVACCWPGRGKRSGINQRQC